MRAINRLLKSRKPSSQRALVTIIKSLFANSEQGVWYDPSDMSTLYQDAAGTIPVTAVEQPVGLMLDKSKGLVQTDVTTLSTWVGPAIGGAAFNTQNVGLVKKVGTYYILSAEVSEYSGTGTVGFVGTDFGGSPVPSRSNNGLIFAIVLASSDIETRVFTRSTNTCKFTNISVRELPGKHASQTTATSRPVLSARVNLLTKTEDFSDSNWAWGNKLTYEAASAPNGENTATKLTTAADVIAARSFTAVATSFEYVIYLKTGAGFTPTALVRNTTTALNLITVRTTSVSGSNQYGSWDVISLDGGWKKIKITVTGGISTGNGLVFYFGNTGLVPIGSYWYIWHPDIRPTNTGVNIPDYQRVNTDTDYDTAGFPKYLKYDMVDDVSIVKFPNALGSNCTITRGSVGGSSTILTGQTIGDTYNVSTTHSGLIILNRSMTETETKNVTKYLYQKGTR